MCAPWVELYLRYSDDILIIVPGGADAGRQVRDHATSQITKFGQQIQVKSSKTSIIAYAPGGSGHASFEFIEGAQGRNGLEYLGFRFDGRKIYLRDSTLSGFYRKITYSLRHQVNAFVARYPGKTIDFLIENFDIEAFIRKFGRVEDFDANSEYQDWTFWTYARRAADEFGPKGHPYLAATAEASRPDPRAHARGVRVGAVQADAPKGGLICARGSHGMNEPADLS